MCLSALIGFLAIVPRSRGAEPWKVGDSSFWSHWVSAAHAVPWKPPCLLAVYGLGFAGKQDLGDRKGIPSAGRSSAYERFPATGHLGYCLTRILGPNLDSNAVVFAWDLPLH